MKNLKMEINTVSSRDLPELLFVSHSDYVRSSIQNVSNINCNKPKGGLWCSPVEENGLTAWENYCEDNTFSMGLNCEYRTPVELHDHARIAKIDSYEDLEAVNAKFPLPNIGDLPRSLVSPIDFEKMVTEFDAIWLTSRGQWATRNSRFDVDSLSLYGWDVESVLVLDRWAIK